MEITYKRNQDNLPSNLSHELPVRDELPQRQLHLRLSYVKSIIYSYLLL
jgi:hypothetical protein